MGLRRWIDIGASSGRLQLIAISIAAVVAAAALAQYCFEQHEPDMYELANEPDSTRPW